MILHRLLEQVLVEIYGFDKRITSELKKALEDGLHESEMLFVDGPKLAETDFLVFEAVHQNLDLAFLEIVASTA